MSVRLLLPIVLVISFVVDVHAGGLSPAIVNSAAFPGDEPLGVCVRPDNGLVYVVDQAANGVRVYDRELNSPPLNPSGPATIANPLASSNDLSGIAWDSAQDQLLWLDPVTGIVAESDASGALIGQVQLAGALPAGLGDLCYDPVMDTLWVVAPGLDQYRQYSRDGFPMGNFDFPSGSFGVGVAYRPDVDALQIPYGGPADPGPVDLILTDRLGNPFGPTIDLFAIGDQVAGVDHASVGSNGSPSVYLVERELRIVFEIDVPLPGSCAVPTDVVTATDCGSGDLLVDWTPDASHVATRVELFDASGLVVFSELYPGLSAGAVVTDLPGGNYTLAVTGICPSGATGGYTRSVDHTANLDDIDNIVVDPPGTVGFIDSAQIVMQVFASTTKDFVRVDSLEDICVDQLGPGKVVWAFRGTFPDSIPLSPLDGQILTEAVLAGASVYLEGSDIWGNDPLTEFADYDGVLGRSSDAGLIDGGDDSLVAVVGSSHLDLDLSFVDGPYVQDQPGDDSIDRLLPTGAAGVAPDIGGGSAGIVLSSGTGYGLAVYYVPDATPAFGANQGRVLNNSSKLGGVKGDDDTTTISTVDGKLKNPIALFTRGDCNGDLAFNIADAIRVLEYLFPGGGPPALILCPDACDVNDDGQLNIADTIYMLSFLFSGGPPPAPPYPDCGLDPTGDGLSCFGIGCT